MKLRRGNCARSFGRSSTGLFRDRPILRNCFFNGWTHVIYFYSCPLSSKGKEHTESFYSQKTSIHRIVGFVIWENDRNLSKTRWTVTGQVDLRSRTSQPVFLEKLTQIGKQITRVRSNRYPRTDATTNRYTEFADRSTITVPCTTRRDDWPRWSVRAHRPIRNSRWCMQRAQREFVDFTVLVEQPPIWKRSIQLTVTAV